MPTASYSAVIDAPAGAIWDRLIDLEAWPKWLRVPWADRSVTLDPPGPAEAGSIVVIKGRLPYRLFARIVALEPERHLALEIERSEYPSDRLLLRRARYTLQLERIDGARTRVTASHEVEGKGIAGRLYMATVFRLFMRANLRNIVRSLNQVGAVGS